MLSSLIFDFFPLKSIKGNELCGRDEKGQWEGNCCQLWRREDTQLITSDNLFATMECWDLFVEVLLMIALLTSLLMKKAWYQPASWCPRSAGLYSLCRHRIMRIVTIHTRKLALYYAFILFIRFHRNIILFCHNNHKFTTDTHTHMLLRFSARL